MYTWPDSDKAAVCESPAETCTIFSGILTFLGIYSEPSSACLPSAPSSLHPNVITYKKINNI